MSLINLSLNLTNPSEETLTKTLEAVAKAAESRAKANATIFTDALKGLFIGFGIGISLIVGVIVLEYAVDRKKKN